MLLAYTQLGLMASAMTSHITASVLKVENMDSSPPQKKKNSTEN